MGRYIRLAGLLALAWPSGARAQRASSQDGAVALVLALAQTEARAEAMLEEARRERDVIRATCLNDKLVQLRAHRRTAQGRVARLLESFVANQRDELQHSAQALEGIAQVVQALRQELDQCVGEDLFDSGASRVLAVVDPDPDEHPRSSPAGTHAPLLAQAGPTDGPPPVPPPLPDADEEARIRTFRASLDMSVFEVEARQDDVARIARGLEGYLDERTEEEITVRVPASRFEEAIAAIEAVGEVVSRHVEARDVTRAHRELRIRLANAEAMRERLLRVLERAQSVEDILRVEAQLERVTLDVEQLRGELAALDGRIAMSTIRVVFRAHPREGSVSPGALRLPVEWLDDLGIGALLNLREHRRGEPWRDELR